jgi:hypothetical protein
LIFWKNCLDKNGQVIATGRENVSKSLCLSNSTFMDPPTAERLKALGAERYKIGDFSGAISFFEKASQAEPDIPVSHYITPFVL